MAHRTLINGTGYDITGGRELIGGTGYAKKKGRVLVNGTGYDVPFSSGIPLSTVALGDILMLNENGSPVPFYVCKHDYESGLNGAGRTLLVRKDCCDNDKFGTSNALSGSTIDKFFNETFKNKLDAAVKTAIGETVFYYIPGDGAINRTTLKRAVFPLSVREFGFYAQGVQTDGSELPIASTLRTTYLDGNAINQWTRTPYSDDMSVYQLTTYGNATTMNVKYFKGGRRPAFTLPSTFPVIQNPDGTYAPAT